MKEIVSFFTGRRYSAVNTSEMQVMGTKQKQAGKTHKSLQTRPSLGRGLSVVDAFFHERKAGKQTRCPKCKFKSDTNRVINFDRNCSFLSRKKIFVP